MTGSRRVPQRRGRPIVAFAGLLAVWISIRLVVWNWPTDEAHLPAGSVPYAQPPIPRVPDDIPFVMVSPIGSPVGSPERMAPPNRRVAIGSKWRATTRPMAVRGRIAPDTPPVAVGTAPALCPACSPHRQQRAATLRQQQRVSPAARTSHATQPAHRAAQVPLWRIDSWVFYRPTASSRRFASGGNRPSTYGGSQVGIVLRRALSRDDHRPFLYTRLTATPDQPRQSELAIGIGGKPLPDVPLQIQAEMRVFDQGGQTEVRPALAVVAELPATQLPLGGTATGYLQSGYVGGGYATAFIDGHLRAEREAITTSTARLFVGGGVSGGVQRGAGRLDIGPSVAVNWDTGPVPLRLALDYRFKLAGDADPPDGVAVTLSAGF
ncbi:hypothetical protein EB810_12215 [Altererythrobacter sp. FM1]|uniref:hypothetical protein n=1 Tax=Tsuneonella flava TaxID=2055955 RepID=UPI000C80092C|nr:hypothetical protein [Tsuneonella flava]ROT93863.1 hypothetical protein EB810_12215 [Altererythrobacter sp. FM1]UBS33003.1 hypothetical protein LBX01_16405 [Altererythrobacter sp. N1]